jgi:hypothetical protein
VRQDQACGWFAWCLFFCYFSLGKQRKVRILSYGLNISRLQFTPVSFVPIVPYPANHFSHQPNSRPHFPRLFSRRGLGGGHLPNNVLHLPDNVLYLPNHVPYLPSNVLHLSNNVLHLPDNVPYLPNNVLHLPVGAQNLAPLKSNRSNPINQKLNKATHRSRNAPPH